MLLEPPAPNPQPPTPMTPVRKVGFVVNQTIANAAEVAGRAEALLRAQDVAVAYTLDGVDGTDWTRGDGLDLICAFGGDGTILRSARIAVPLQIPIFGVNLGRVGFLSEIGPEGM